MSEVNSFIKGVKDIVPVIQESTDSLFQLQQMTDVCKKARRLIFIEPFYTEQLQNIVAVCKEVIPPSYIIQFDIKDEEKIEPKDFFAAFYRSKVCSSPEETLDKAVLNARGLIQAHSEELNSKNPYTQFANIDGFKSFDLGNRCATVCEYMSNILNGMRIKNETHCIYAGFSMIPRVRNYLIKHYFLTADLMGKKYLIDCSYSQFFMLKDNILEYHGIEDFELPFPGIYMLQNESRRTTARTILERGWIEATSQNLRNYFDGFAHSFRNGCYYEENGFNYYNTRYDDKDYRSFIVGNDSQLNHEGKGYLGYQTYTSYEDVNFSKGTVLLEDKSKKLIKSM